MTKWLSLLLALLSLTGCQYEKPTQQFLQSSLAMEKPSVADSESGTLLNIPNLHWDTFTPGVERVGWCGEVSLQMIALYYGRYYSQKVINQLGQPKHLDLYSDDIKPVMQTLGMNYRTYPNPPERSASHYLAWAKQQLTQGHPVFSGVKSVPGGNPAWSLDHFVVLVGYGIDDVFYNSNRRQYGQVRVSDDEFTGSTAPYSLKNRQNHFFGFAITGFQQLPHHHARVFVLAESADQVDLGIRVDGLHPGKTYQLWRQSIHPIYGEKTMLTRITTQETSFVKKDLLLNKHKGYQYWVEFAGEE